MTCYHGKLQWASQLPSVSTQTEGISCLYCIMITGSVIELLWLFMPCFVLLFFLPYCTNGLLNLPIRIQLSVRKPSLLWKVLSLWTAYSVSGCTQTEYQRRVCRDLFSREQKHSIQRRDSWCWMGLRTQKADAGAGAAPTCAGDQGPAWCAWTEREKCLLFRCEFQMGGRAIKSIRPELSLRVKARRLSDMHMCSAAHFWKHIHAILTLPPLLKLPP